MLRIYYYSIFYLFITKSNLIFCIAIYYACLLFRAILFLYLNLRLWCLVLAPPCILVVGAILVTLGVGIGGGVLPAFCCACNRCCDTAAIFAFAPPDAPEY